MNNPIDDKVRERESWAKIAGALILIILFAWKVLDGSIYLSEFKFSELLSLLLALFAIVLSVLFYFKATDHSNAFYDNTYKFTKDISEVLGRMEAGFGEKLRHIDEGYTGLLQGKYFNPESAQKEIANEEKELKKKEEEKLKLIEELTTRAKLQQHEKQTFMKSLQQKDEELLNLKREIRFLQRETDAHSTIENTEIPQPLEDYIMSYVFKMIEPRYFYDAPPSVLRKRFRTIAERFPADAIKDMKSANLIDDELMLTEKGTRILKRMSRRF